MADVRGRRGTVNARLQDRAIAHAIYLQRLRSGLVRDVVGLLNEEVLGPLAHEIASRLDIDDQTGLGLLRREELFRALRDVAFAGFETSRLRLFGDLADLAEYEASWQARAVRAALPPIDVAYDVPAPATLRALVESRPFDGRTLREWWGGVAADTQARVQTTLREGVAVGRTNAEIVSRLRDVEFPGTARNAAAVVRTAAQEVSTAARMATFEENDDLVKGWQFVATLDSRTTLVCAAQDGKVYGLGEGQPPPLHWQCRSTTVPVLKSAAELGLPIRELPPGARASMDGAVAAKTDYDAWLRRQPKAVQVDALGEGRAALFRGGLRIDRFVDDGRVLSLAELSALDG